MLSPPLRPFAQQQEKVWRIGYLDFGSRQTMVDSGRYAALMDGLREHGYVEGRNFIFESRFAEGNASRLDGLAAELVRGKADLILSTGTPGSHAAHRATSSIPIVVTSTTDPVREGFAASLARPGGNLTGMTTGNEETVQKLVELLAVFVPKLKRIAVLTNPATNSHPPQLLSIRSAARHIGKQVMSVSANTPDQIERSFATMARERAEAVIIVADTFMLQQRAQIAALALKYRLPSAYPRPQYPEAGGLMSYGAEINDNFRRVGIFVDKILRGAKPGDIPFEQPTRYYMVINRKTANALGVKIIGELLVRADRVIE